MQSRRELVERARAGDKSAFGMLAEMEWTALVSLARSIVGQLHCEDLVQDALVVAWRKLHQLEQAEAFAGWLRRIVIRKSLQKARQRFWRIPIEALRGREEPSQEANDTPDMERILEFLAPRQRAVIYLTAIEGMTDREIGDLLEIEPSSVRSHRRRAREVLKKKMIEGRSAGTALGEMG